VIKSKGFNTGAMDNNNYNRFGSSYPLRSSAKMFNVQYGGHYFIGFRVVKDVE
jgi:formylglycine-generating enzyme required for sulfatase activity